MHPFCDTVTFGEADLKAWNFRKSRENVIFWSLANGDFVNTTFGAFGNLENILKNNKDET